MTQRPARQSARVKALRLGPGVMEDVSFATRCKKNRTRNKIACQSRRKNRS